MEFFPRVEKYSTDAAYLGEMLAFFKRECSDFLVGRGGFSEGYDNAKGWHRQLEDGRDCVTQFPHGHAATAQYLLQQPPHDMEGSRHTEQPPRELHFVGFFGIKRANLEQDLVDYMARLTRDLMAGLSDNPDMILYAYAEMKEKDSHDSNYYNLAVTRHDSTGQKWKGEPLHLHEAINNLSPKYYTTVRIHTGVLPDGLDSKELHLKRSVFLDYRAHQKDPSEPIQREEKYWTS